MIQKRFPFRDDSVLNSLGIVILSSKFLVCDVKLTEFKEINSVEKTVCMNIFCDFFGRVMAL